MLEIRKMKTKMIADHLYRFIFSRSCFYKLHKLFLCLALKGMGVSLDGNLSDTGEEFILSKLSSKKTKIIFDIGANVGHYSKELVKYFPNSKIYAFEPVSENIIAYKKLHGTNKNIELIPWGLGKEDSKEMIYYPKFKGASSLASIHNVFRNNEDLRGEEIHLIKLNDFCKQRNINKIDFMKIDVEGNELSVLQGAKRLIEEGKIKIIQFEFNWINVYSKVFMEDFRELLKDYDLYRLLPRGLLKIDFSKKTYYEIYNFQNILAINKK